ncbi:hypothetical protein L0V05_03695 [Tabrizicola sp. J26]|uniref:hypothetical protein n=1 Tax=Alitabrizicola rongguiensis TaxID=2909234 RepID=UPI001F3A8F54|nr:hypothetical protein [Tabrizicola rongguiensis]MCF1707917.1 hypothetical protein [Tabrizicola rongguiensis]
MCRFCEQASLGEQEAYDPQLGRGGFLPGANLPPDLILCDGPILTMDESRPEVTAIAIRQGVIRAVGRTEEVLSSRGRGTRVVRLEGRAVLPGFVGTGLRLPEARDRAALDRWIEGRARAGYTTVDVATLGRDWGEYRTLSGLIDRRHRLRLRGAVEEGLRQDWREGALDPGHGNDLVRIEALQMRPPADSAAMERAEALHRDGWDLVFDCAGDGGLTPVLQLAALAGGRRLAGMRVLSPRAPAPAEEAALQAAGLSVVTPPEADPVATLTGPRDVVLARIDRLTRRAARLAGLAAIAGQIRPGTYADLAILDRSPLWPGAEAPKLVQTWIEGVPVTPEADRDQI